MQRITASVPKPSPVGSTHSLAELGALSSANTTAQYSTNFYTRPVASVPKATPVGAVASINTPSFHPGVPQTPRATPAGVTSHLVGNVQISTPLGGPKAHVAKNTVTLNEQ